MILTRLASKIWNGNHNGSNNEDALFIDHNGEQFQYCLDYMWDGGNVVLPPTIPKDALLRDLEYYGFHCVDASKISAQAKETVTVLKIYIDFTTSDDTPLKKCCM